MRGTSRLRGLPVGGRTAHNGFVKTDNAVFGAPFEGDLGFADAFSPCDADDANAVVAFASGKSKSLAKIF